MSVSAAVTAVEIAAAGDPTGLINLIFGGAISEAEAQAAVIDAGGTQADIDRLKNDLAALKKQQAKDNPDPFDVLKKGLVIIAVVVVLYFALSLYLESRHG